MHPDETLAGAHLWEAVCLLRSAGKTDVEISARFREEADKLVSPAPVAGPEPQPGPPAEEAHG